MNRALDNPAWFAAVMGTGGVALVAQSNPGQWAGSAVVSQALAWVLFVLAAALFLVLLGRALLVGRLGRGVLHEVRTPGTGAAWAAFPGAINVLSLGLLHIADAGGSVPGRWAVAGGATVGTLLGLALTVAFFTAAFEQDDFRAEDISGTWFIPETVILLGATLFGLLSELAAESWQRSLAVVSLALLGIGMVLFGFTAMLFFNRVVLHRQVDRVGVPAMWIMISPLSVSSLALVAVSADTSMLGGMSSPAVLQTAHFLAALLWGFSLWWVAAATVLTVHVGRAALTYTPADWGFVFPAAALTLSTSDLARFWDSGLVEGVAVVFSLLLLAVWATVVLASVLSLTGRRLAAAAPATPAAGSE